MFRTCSELTNKKYTLCVRETTHKHFLRVAVITKYTKSHLQRCSFTRETN